MKIFVPDFCNCSLNRNLVLNFSNCFPKSKNILIKWSRIYKACLFQNRKHVPETETCGPCVPEIENLFPQKFCLRVPLGKPSFRGIEDIALQYQGNEYIFSKAHNISGFDMQFLALFIGI